jgi:hypothetical protein
MPTRMVLYPRTSSECASPYTPCHLFGLILLQDWARHRRECVPTASAHSNMIATPPPAQPQFVNVSAILFAPQEGISDASSCSTRTLSRTPRSPSNHYRYLRASSHTCSGFLPDSARSGLFPWRTSQQRRLDPRPEWGAVAIPAASVVFSQRLGHECSSESGHLPHHFRCSSQALVWSCDCPQVQWIEEAGLFRCWVK